MEPTQVPDFFRSRGTLAVTDATVAETGDPGKKACFEIKVASQSIRSGDPEPRRYEALLIHLRNSPSSFSVPVPDEGTRKAMFIWYRK